MKTVTMHTNFNQKLAGNFITHISQAPPAPVPAEKLGQEYQISVLDNSHPPVKAELMYFIRFNLGSACDVYTMASHGMDAADFMEWFKTNNPDTDYGTELAAYFYKRA